MQDVDVVVIGAGYAGLATALDLTDRGRSVVVLEAGDRVGGRVWSREQGGVTVDLGGQWVGPTQTAYLAWIRRFGCATFPSHDDGRHLELWPGTRALPYVSGELPAARDSHGYHAVLDRLDAMAARIDVAAPHAAPDLPDQDSRTFADWLHAEVASADVRRRLRIVVQGLWACEPRDVSLFHVLFYVASAGGFHQLLGTLGCAQDRRLVGGADGPARAAAAALGDAVRLLSPVTEVTWTDEGVEVRTPTSTVRARRLVVTGTPPAQSRIRFAPALPLARRRWLARSPMGEVAKVHVTYAEPFWRAAGLSGQLTAYDDSPVAYTFDNSPADASRGVLVGFVYGDDYRAWASQPAEVRRRAVLDTLTALGEQAAEPLGYHEARWPELPWAEGAYAAVPSPGTWLEHGATGWREPVGPIHWAGTETASVWNGYIDGAISSGERAAAEVLASLGAGAAAEQESEAS